MLFCWWVAKNVTEGPITIVHPRNFLAINFSRESHINTFESNTESIEHESLSNTFADQIIHMAYVCASYVNKINSSTHLSQHRCWEMGFKMTIIFICKQTPTNTLRMYGPLRSSVNKSSARTCLK